MRALQVGIGFVAGMAIAIVGERFRAAWRFVSTHLRAPRAFVDVVAHMHDEIEVVTNDEFTRAYDRLPVEHHTRVNVAMRGGERFTGEAGGEKGDLAQPKYPASRA